MTNYKVAVVMGSDSDWPVVKPAVDLLKQFDVEAIVRVASAHRTPLVVKEFVESTAKEVAAFIAAAGAAAHLGGVIASYTVKPVIGIPVDASPLKGLDALLATVQMPPGVPVATMAVNGAKNAAVFALQIIGASDEAMAAKLKAYREKMATEVAAKNENLQALISE